VRRPAKKPTKHVATTVIAPASGTLVVRARPWAMVSIDGAPAVRVEPPQRSFVLPVGRHDIELANPVTAKREEHSVAITADGSATLTANLEAK
jgi:hypothetical protein